MPWDAFANIWCMATLFGGAAVDAKGTNLGILNVNYAFQPFELSPDFAWLL